jgi:integrase
MRRDRFYPGASKFRDRHGKWRWRARGKGKPTVMLSGEYGSPEFEAAWNAWANGKPLEVGKNRVVPGTISALLIDYYQSPEFNVLAHATQKTYRATLERFREKNGTKFVTSITTHGIVSGIRDKLKADAWNMMLRALRHLCRYAVARAKMASDPTNGLRKAKTGKSDGFHTWTIEEVEQFEKRHPLGTKAHVALSVLLYTAQRRGDAVALGRQHERDGGTSLRFRQRKTGEWLELPIVAPLRAAIDACPPKGLTFIETTYGRPFTAAGFGNWFRDRCNEADLLHCSAHGLRKAAATRLADAGCTVHEIKAITGHKSLSEVQRYTKAADQKRLARSVADIVAGTKKERKTGKLPTRFANAPSKPLKLKG